MPCTSHGTSVSHLGCQVSQRDYVKHNWCFVSPQADVVVDVILVLSTSHHHPSVELLLCVLMGVLLATSDLNVALQCAVQPNHLIVMDL